MTNSLSEDIYALGELMATNLVTQGVASADADDGLTTLAGKILDITASTTTLTIEVPLNLVYSDDFNITGTLTDGNDDAISGATVKLKVGDTVVDTDTTDNDGEVSFTQAPVSMGNHSFQLIFEGDSTHPPAISSVVTREIGKETTAITVSSPAASSSYYTDASISVTGTLKTDDNEAISGASVLVKLGATTLTTLTTGNDGSFSGSVSAGNLSSGSNTLKFEFAGDSYYSTTYQEVAVTVNAVSLALTSNKSILSYADSDSCTLTATYTGASVTGKTVKLYKASDDSEITTMTDNNDGTYTATYNSAGVGDISFYAKVGTLQSEIYEIYIKIDLTSYLLSKSDYEYKQIWIANAGSASNLSMSSDTATLSANATAHHTQEFTDKNHYILEFNMKTASSPGYDDGFGIGEDSSHFVAMHFQAQTAYFRASTNNQNNASFNKRYTSYVPVKITRDGNNFNININNGELDKDLVADVEIPNKFFMLKFSWGDISVKDMKLTVL